MIKPVLFITGIVFGYILINSGVSNYDNIRNMFLLRDIHLYGVICIAIGASILPNFLIYKYKMRAVLTGETIDMTELKPTKESLIGGLVAGTGWALTGACPGPALAQVGFGTMAGIFTVLGALIGTYLYGLNHTE